MRIHSAAFALRFAPSVLVVLACAAPAAAQTPAAVQAAPSRPNVILIITDDVGYGDIGSYGAPDIKTPNIDSLAKNGTRLTDFYAAPNCSPTRAMLISGRYQQRYRIENPLGAARTAQEQGLPATGRTLPQLLKNNGYRTGLVGKWHLGYKPEFSPNAHGFDYFFGFKSGLIDYYQHTDQVGEHDLFENAQPTHVDRLLDGSVHRAIGEVHRGERQPAVLPRSGLQRRALAVPGAGPSVGGAGQRRDSSSRRRIRPTRGRTTPRFSSARIKASERFSRRSSAWA